MLVPLILRTLIALNEQISVRDQGSNNAYPLLLLFPLLRFKKLLNYLLRYRVICTVRWFCNSR